ncbi:MAG: hypothetical protein GY851_26035 [bacterium]|nr:hypothetical protein [bacterium]
MARDTLEFTYQFKSDEPDHDAWTIKIVLDADTLEQIRTDPPDVPDWAQLGHHQCEMCPLSEEESPTCPAALALRKLVTTFGALPSFVDVETTVVTRERTTTAVVSAQRALSSVLGLCSATSGCPILARFKPMARFHLPFATRDETVFRSVGAYLVAQYFAKTRGEEADLELTGLKAIYDQIHSVNVGLSKRLRGLLPGDAGMNALVALDLFAQELPYSIERNLMDLEPYFDAFRES